MSKFKEHATKKVAAEKIDEKKVSESRVTNFMGGNSYTLNPVDTLRIVAASSIFGEPSYYRDGYKSEAYVKNLSTAFSGLGFELKDTKGTLDLFTSSIKAALDYDFDATLQLALRLRTEFNMRFNPSVIFMEAVLHHNREKYNKENGDKMRNIGLGIIQRPDDMANMFEYYMFVNGSKNRLPSIAKRIWANKLESLRPYHLAKYKSKSLIDLVRISHPKYTDALTELVKTGNVTVKDDDQTWEKMRSEGKKWQEILDTIRVPHMALLRNLRGIWQEGVSKATEDKLLADLKGGVPYGKQFPFRYWSAYNELKGMPVKVLDALEECIDIAVQNFPKLSGRVMCLADNSGSATGGLVTEFGTTNVNVVANLSSIVTASRSEEGWVGLFGDRLHRQQVSKRNGILSQLKEANVTGPQQGGNTENGIWIFFDEAIKKKEWWDTVFVYSDQQAGHGGLYGTDPKQYANYLTKGRYIDVLALVKEYRKKVNPNLNVFSVQVAGYNNSVIPESLYRGAILSGWTGNETVYAKEIIDVWDNINAPKQ